MARLWESFAWRFFFSSVFRDACQTGMASVSLEGDSALLQLGADLSVSLSRLGSPQSHGELRELLFRMAESLSCKGGPGEAPPYGMWRYVWSIRQASLTSFSYSSCQSHEERAGRAYRYVHAVCATRAFLCSYTGMASVTLVQV